MKKMKKIILFSCCWMLFSPIFSQTNFPTEEKNKIKEVYYNTALTAISHNIFNKVICVGNENFISLEINEINDTLIFTSSEINFIMEGEFPKIFNALNGLPYILPIGTSVVAMGENATDDITWIPTKDIRDVNRKSNPDIGATDYYPVDTYIQSKTLSDLSIAQKDNLLIIQSVDEIGTIQIRDISGKLIFSSYESSNRFVKLVNQKGLYIISCNNNNNLFVKKIVFR